MRALPALLNPLPQFILGIFKILSTSVSSYPALRPSPCLHRSGCVNSDNNVRIVFLSNQKNINLNVILIYFAM